jgi:hypothetical protein
MIQVRDSQAHNRVCDWVALVIFRAAFLALILRTLQDALTDLFPIRGVTIFIFWSYRHFLNLRIESRSLRSGPMRGVILSSYSIAELPLFYMRRYHDHQIYRHHRGHEDLPDSLPRTQQRPSKPPLSLNQQDILREFLRRMDRAK